MKKYILLVLLSATFAVNATNIQAPGDLATEGYVDKQIEKAIMESGVNQYGVWIDNKVAERVGNFEIVKLSTGVYEYSNQDEKFLEMFPVLNIHAIDDDDVSIDATLNSINSNWTIRSRSVDTNSPIDTDFLVAINYQTIPPL